MSFSPIVVTCNSPIPQQDNVVSLSCGNKYGSVATYACPEGQRSAAIDRPVTCDDDGVWRGQVGECEGRYM